MKILKGNVEKVLTIFCVSEMIQYTHYTMAATQVRL